MSLTKVSYSMIAGAAVNVLDYGASPSASVSANTAAINQALATGKSVYLPEGTYDINDALTPVGNQTLFGETQLGTVIRQTATNKNAITIDSAAGVFVRDLRLTSVAASTSNGIYITASNPTYIQNVRIDSFYKGIYGKSCNNIFLTQPYVINCLLDGMDFEDCIDVYLNNIYSGGHVNGAALAFTANSDGLYVNGAQLVTSTYNFIARKASGGSTFPGHAFINQMICDSAVANGNGIYLEFCNSFLFFNCWASNQGGGSGKNFYIGPGATDTQVIGGKFFNCTGHGIDVRGTGTIISGASVEDASVGAPNTYDGIRLLGAQKTTITGVRCYTNTATQRKGISVASGCVDTKIVNCDLDNNVSGDYECLALTTNNTYQKQYQNATITVPNGVTQTLHTFAAEKQGNYLFFAGQADNANGGIRAMAYVRVGSGSLALTSIVAAGGLTLSATGSNLAVQVANTAGGDVVVDYSFIRLS